MSSVPKVNRFFGPQPDMEKGEAVVNAGAARGGVCGAVSRAEWARYSNMAKGPKHVRAATPVDLRRAMHRRQAVSPRGFMERLNPVRPKCMYARLRSWNCNLYRRRPSPAPRTEVTGSPMPQDDLGGCNPSSTPLRWGWRGGFSPC